MTDFPDLKLKTLVSFPATIIDGIGIDTIKANGTYQFNLAYDDFAPPVSNVTDPTNQNALIWNKITSQYALVPISTLVAGSLTPSNANPIMDGVAAPGVATPYSREDHRHPTDTTLAPLASPALTGTPTAPTAAVGTNTTQIASTAFVQSKIGTVKVQTFTASGTYTPNANLTYADIECLGGGAGGGGTAAPAASTMAFGGGGGSGGYSRSAVSAATIGASQTVTIGAAGGGGASGNNAGGSGGATSVGTLVVANGGTGGAGNSGSDSSGGAGAGGTAGTGTLALTGFNGQPKSSHGAIFPDAAGASSPFGLGQGGFPSAQQGTGLSASGRGAGGAGSVGYNTVAAAGGAGTAGLVIITEYCSQ